MLNNFKLPFISSKSYLQLKRDSNDEEEAFISSGGTLTEKSDCHTGSKWYLRILSNWKLPWLLLALLVLANVAYLLFSPIRRVPWVATDFKSARNAISHKLVQFKSSLDLLDDKGHTYRVYDSEGPVYVGNGTEVDGNWKALFMPQYNDIIISPEEATSVNGELYLNTADDTYAISLGVFHHLHCLNTIRKRVYSHLHPEMLSPEANIHVDHCIEALREVLMCGGDMTPIPYEWSIVGNRAIPNSATMHVCRDYDQLRAWMVERHSS